MPDQTVGDEPSLARFTPICAIGASAGGVGALQELFRRLPDQLGLAYVVILHLAPDQPSALREILGLCTGMPVFQVQDSPTLKPNCVYVIAPDTELVISGDDVSSRPFSEPRGRRAPIDLFFRSVAAARGDGVAMVLSGTGSDGAQGARFVKEAGGVVMVQEPAEAEFAAMPQNAIATGAADFVARIATLAERLQDVARSKEAVRSLDMDGAANELRRIIGLLRHRTGHDFASYKRATVMRRVTRRMQVCRLTSLTAYAEMLNTTPEEAKELFSDLLISVTMFFRDPRAFEALAREAVVPLMNEQEDSRADEGVRAWVIGCATGEEAYSLAILFLEAAQQRKLHVPIQIFATDLDEGALATAREGRYPKTIEANVSEQRLARFFVDEGTHYRVRKEVREAVIFAVHSVLKEPPFLRLDLISCRNLLIYLERSLQQQLYALFHYGMKPGRYLFLGSAEMADSSTEAFVTLDREARIYTARARAGNGLPVLPRFPTLPDQRQRQRPAPEASPTVVAHHVDALEHVGPPSALVDAGEHVVNLSATAGRFLLHSAGPPSIQLPAMVRPELRLDLKLALGRALNGGKTTLTHPVVVAFEGERRHVSVHVAPVTVGDDGQGHALVSFLAGDTVASDEDLAAVEVARPEAMLRLQAELKTAQEALVSSRRNHDATIQDLSATNEELQSTNEEYRSTAEELETSREELQSINEELHTVNAELKSKFEHVSHAHSDLQNLTMVMDVGTLFLDTRLRIKMFTPPIVDVFPITKADMGRVITDFTNRLNDAELVGEARQVLLDLAPVEREVRSATGQVFVMRMRPYRTVENRIEGVVLTFVDISFRLKMELALGRSEQQLRALVRSTSQVLFRMNADWTEMRELVGGDFLSNRDSPTAGWVEHYVPAEDREQVQAAIDRAIAGRSTFDLEHRTLRENGVIGWTRSRAIPILDVDGEIVEWCGSAEDTTSHHRAQGARRESEERLRVLVEGVPQHVWRADSGGLWTWSSPQWHRYTGLLEVESRGNGWLAAVHPDDRDGLMRAWFDVASSHAFEAECRIRNMDGSQYRWFRGRALPLLDERRRVTEWLGTFTDVDDLRQLQGRQEVLLAELQHRVRNIMAVTRIMADRTAENSTTVADYNARLKGRLDVLARTQVMLTRETGVGVDLRALVHDELRVQTSAGEVEIEGPDVTLSAKAAEVLALALHELATNAVKHGALSTAGGSVRVRWDRQDEGGESLLTLTWTETGAEPDLLAPRRKGFGTQLIEGRVPYELGGTGRLDLQPGGMQASISFPLRPGDSILQTDAQSARAPGRSLP